jgi:hypothetical protein
MKISPTRTEFFYEGEKKQAGIQTDMIRVTVAFRSVANSLTERKAIKINRAMD